MGECPHFDGRRVPLTDMLSCSSSPIDRSWTPGSARLLAAYESGEDQWLINTWQRRIATNRVCQQHNEFLVTGRAERDLGPVFSILLGISHGCTR